MKLDQKLNCILLVDDDDASNFLHQLIIQKAQVVNHIKVAKNGQEAIDYLTRRNKFADLPEDQTPTPELIFLDINMPVMNGWEFLDAFEKEFQGNSISTVIIMLTSALPEKWEKEAARKGLSVANFIEKPLKKDHLLKVIEEYFSDTAK